MKKKVLIEDLVLLQHFVYSQGIEDCKDKFEFNNSLDLPYCRFCEHNNKFYVFDGHHTIYTLYHIFNKKEINIIYDPCVKSIENKKIIPYFCAIDLFEKPFLTIKEIKEIKSQQNEDDKYFIF